MIRLLGQVPDAEVARLLAVHPTTAYNKRRSLGIAPYGEAYRSRAFEWTQKALGLLGRFSDTQVARRLGIARSTAELKRRELGIPGIGKGPGPVHWTAAMTALLGKVSDPEVARRFGIARATVARKRKALGVRPYRWLRRLPLVRGPELRELLRTMTQAELKRQYGIAEVTEPRLRSQLKVPPPPPRSKKNLPKHQWTDQERALVGKLSDEAVAARVGVSIAAVRQQKHLRFGGGTRRRKRQSGGPARPSLRGSSAGSG